MAIGRQHTLAAAWVLGRAAAPAWAAAPDYQAVNTALVEDYVIPLYAAFAQATAALEGALAAACEDGRPTPEEAGAAYHNAMDAWTAVQHLRFGPSLLFLRYDRIEFWPDKRGVVRRHLSQLLSEQDAEALQPRTFANGSVAVQGFPALERLLFDSDDDTWAMPFGCDVVRAIGTNLKSIAAGLLHDWRDGDKAFATVVLSAGEGNTHRSEEHTSELQSLMRISYAVFCLKKNNQHTNHINEHKHI